MRKATGAETNRLDDLAAPPILSSAALSFPLKSDSSKNALFLVVTRELAVTRAGLAVGFPDFER